MTQYVLEEKVHCMSLLIFFYHSYSYLPWLHLVWRVAPLVTIAFVLEVPIPDILGEMKMLEIHDSDPLVGQDPWTI